VWQDIADVDVFEDYHGERVILSGTRRCRRIVNPVQAWIESRREELTALLRELVECESPSDDAAAVNRFQELLAARLAGFGRASFHASARGGRGRNLLLEFDLPGRGANGPAAFSRWATPTRCGAWAR